MLSIIPFCIVPLEAFLRGGCNGTGLQWCKVLLAAPLSGGVCCYPLKRCSLRLPSHLVSTSLPAAKSTRSGRVHDECLPSTVSAFPSMLPVVPFPIFIYLVPFPVTSAALLRPAIASLVPVVPFPVILAAVPLLVLSDCSPRCGVPGDPLPSLAAGDGLPATATERSSPEVLLTEMHVFPAASHGDATRRNNAREGCLRHARFLPRFGEGICQDPRGTDWL